MKLFHVVDCVENRDWIVLASNKKGAVQKIVKCETRPDFKSDLDKDEDLIEVVECNEVVEILSSTKVDVY